MTTTFNKRQLASDISVFAVAAVLTLAAPADAQTTSTVEGHAAAGSTVTVTDLNTGHTDTARVDPSGHYIIPGLPPSTYRVQSGGSAQVVVVPLGQSVTVDLAARAPAPGAAIVVTGSRSRDVTTPAVATNVSQFQIENLPNGDRNFLNFAALAPGSCTKTSWISVGVSMPATLTRSIWRAGTGRRSRERVAPQIRIWLP